MKTPLALSIQTWAAIITGGVATLASVLWVVSDRVEPIYTLVTEFVDQQNRVNTDLRDSLKEFVEGQRKTNEKLDAAVLELQGVKGATEINGVRIQATNDQLRDLMERVRDLEKNGR